MPTTVQVLDLKIVVSSLGQAVDEVQSLMDSGGRHYVCFIEGNLLHHYFNRPKEIAEVLYLIQRIELLEYCVEEQAFQNAAFFNM